MRKLIYWVALCKDDRAEYSIRTRTRRRCEEIRKIEGEERFEKPKKVVIEYTSAFDLARQLLGEGGRYNR